MTARGRVALSFALGAACCATAAAGERFGFQLEGGIGTKPYPTAVTRGLDVGGDLDYRLRSSGGASVWLEAGVDYRRRPANRAAYSSGTSVYAGGGGLKSVSGSVRLKGRLLSGRMLSPYATAGLRIAHDTSPAVLVTAGAGPFPAPALGPTSATKALFEAGVGMRLRVAGRHGIIAELHVDDGTSVFPGTLWSLRFGYRIGP